MIVSRQGSAVNLGDQEEQQQEEEKGLLIHGDLLEDHIEQEVEWLELRYDLYCNIFSSIHDSSDYSDTFSQSYVTTKDSKISGEWLDSYVWHDERSGLLHRERS